MCCYLNSFPGDCCAIVNQILYLKSDWFPLVIFFVSLFRGANLSESEAEQDGDHNITELPQVYSGRGNMAAEQSAVRLTEVI